MIVRFTITGEMKGLTIPLIIDVDIQDQDWFLTPEELSKRFGDHIFSQLQNHRKGADSR